MMKTSKNIYETPSVEVVPILPLMCYCDISGGSYNKPDPHNPDPYDPDSD